MEQVLQVPADPKQNRFFILGSLSFGHGISHLYDQGLPVFFPVIATALGLGNWQVAVLHGIRQAGFGGVNLGTGVFIDMLKAQWGFILTGCMFWSAIAYVAIGAAPNFPLMIVAVSLASIPGALWHLPATAALSRRFPDKRGFAVSVHGFGSYIGNVLGPILAGALLGVMVYKHVLFIYTVPSVLVAVFVWWSLRDLGREDDEPTQRPSFSSQLSATKEALRDPRVLGLVFSAAIMGVGLNAMFNWTPFYLEKGLDEGGLGFGHLRTGVYFALLSGMGIASAPLLGTLSDRVGRKQILVPGLAVLAVLSMLVVSAGDGVMLPVALAGMGLFTFSLQQIVLAAVLDMTGRGTEAATVGFIFGLNGIIGAASPFLATVVINHLGGYGSVFYYAGILTAASGLIVVITPFAALGRDQAQSA